MKEAELVSQKEIKAADLIKLKEELEALSDSVLKLKNKANDILDITKKTFEKLENQISYIRTTVHKDLQEVRSQWQTMFQKMEDWEESMWYIQHSIKKNQFLYAHYPDDWVKDYQDLKEAQKFENDQMDKKIQSRL